MLVAPLSLESFYLTKSLVMSQFRNKEEVFEEIGALAIENGKTIGDPFESLAWYKEQIRQRRPRYACMADVGFGVRQ